MDKTGGQAFPMSCTSDGHAPNVDPGMTLRDYFAAKALPELIADGEALQAVKLAAQKNGSDGLMITALLAYAYADAMLKARTK